MTNRRPTLRDVAALSGVSVTTASAALRGVGRQKPETVARVHAAAEQVGYQANVMARGLRSGGHGLVIIVLFEDTPAEGGAFPKVFWSRALLTLDTELADAGHASVLLPYDDFSLTSEIPVALIVLINPAQSHDFDEFFTFGVPVVLISGQSHPDPRIASTICWDFNQEVDIAMTHLRDNGAQEPALLVNPTPLTPVSSFTEAYGGWCARLGVDPHVIESNDVASATRDLLAAGIDAVAVHGDDAAGDVLEVRRAIEQAGLTIPGDVLLLSLTDRTLERDIEASITRVGALDVPVGSLCAELIANGLATGSFDSFVITSTVDARASTHREHS